MDEYGIATYISSIPVQSSWPFKWSRFWSRDF